MGESFGLVSQQKQRAQELALERGIRLKETEARIAIEMKKQELKLTLEFEQEKAKLQAQITESQNKNLNSLHVEKFDISKSAQLVGSFQESDPEAFFEAFEKFACQLEWEKKYWSVLVQTKFTGKARVICNNLSYDDSKDYDFIKKTVLLAYDQVQETYRQRFRSFRKSSDCTFIEYAEELTRLFGKWLKASGVKDYESLKNLMLLDQFKFRAPPDLRIYLEEKEVKTLNEAARLADMYSITHRRNLTSGSNINVKGFSGIRNFEVSGGDRRPVSNNR